MIYHGSMTVSALECRKTILNSTHHFDVMILCCSNGSLLRSQAHSVDQEQSLLPCFNLTRNAPLFTRTVASLLKHMTHMYNSPEDHN